MISKITDEPRTSPSRRIAAVDAARGCAMILVCLSHIRHHFVETAPALYWWLTATTRIATPTFLLLSGFVISHLLRTDPNRRVGLHLVDRGLFLILVAHLMLGIADLPAEGGWAVWLLSRSEITDVIGIALFAAVLLRSASATTLAALGITLCVASWVIAMTVTAHTEWTQLLGAVLFQLKGAGGGAIEAPVVPYLGMFLLGMALSVQLAPALRLNDHPALAQRLFYVAAVALTIVAGGIIAWHFGKTHLPEALRSPDVQELLRGTLDPRSKAPPSPAYFLFYGAAGLLLTAWFFGGRPLWLTAPSIRIASVIGRASLMCFIVQELLFFAVPRVLGFDGVTAAPFWFSYLAACLLLLYWLATRWDRAGGNRFLTVGLKRLRNGTAGNGGAGAPRRAPMAPRSLR